MMKTSLLTGFAIACAASAFAASPAQAPTGATTAQPQGSANQTMTIVGCVGGGATAADAFMLSDVSLGSVGTTTPGQIATATPPPVTTAGGATAAGTAATSAAGAGTPGATAATGTTGTTTTTASAGTTGATATAGTSVAGGTAGTAVGAAANPAAPGSATAAINSYRLSGADVAGFRGQRVQIVGSWVEPTATANAPAPATAAGTGVREFRVQSISSIAGTCPQR